MRRYEHLIYWLILFSGIFLGAVTAEAAPRPLTDLGYFHWANQSVTPAENTFVMHYGENTKIEPIEGDVYSDYLTVGRSAASLSKAVVKNVGYYQGKAVNLLVTLKKNQSNMDGGSISFDKSYFLGITVIGEVMVSLDFIDQDGNPMIVKTAFNYYGLNANKYIGYKNPGNLIHSLYADNPTHILYDTSDGGKDDYWLYLKNQTPGIPWRDPRQRFELVTNAISNMTFVVHNNDNTPSSIVYFTDFLSKPEFPPAYASDSKFEKVKGVSLNAKQTIPNVDQWQKSQQIEIDFNLDQVEKTKQFEFEKVCVTNFAGDDLTDLFTSKMIDEKKIQIVAKNPSDNRLYDTVLQYQVILKWIGKEHPVDPSIISDGDLDLPFNVNTIFDGTNLGEKSASSLVNYSSQVTVAFLGENDNILLASLIKKGILTTSFDLSDDYPEIAGYTPIKNNRQDKGTFLPDNQLVVHRYKKGQPLHFELLNKESPLLVSRFNNKRELAIQYSQDPSKEKASTLSFVAKYQDEEKVVKEIPSAPQKGAAKITFAFPEEWIGHEVSFYMKDTDGQESNMETRIIEKEKGPSLSLPDEISFGEVAIPTEDKVVFPITKDKAQIEDYSKLDRSRWKVKVKEEQPLTNEDQKILAHRLIIKGDKSDFQINNSDQEIWSGSGSASFDLSKDLKLAVHPSDTVGSYHGSLRWTFEDAP